MREIWVYLFENAVPQGFDVLQTESQEPKNKGRYIKGSLKHNKRLFETKNEVFVPCSNYLKKQRHHFFDRAISWHFVAKILKGDLLFCELQSIKRWNSNRKSSFVHSWKNQDERQAHTFDKWK